MRHARPQGFLGDGFGQDDVGRGVGEPAAVGVQARVVGGKAIALAPVVSLHRRIGALESYRLNFQTQQIGIVLQVQLGGSALGNADGRPGQFGCAGQIQIAVDDKALAVIIHSLGKVAPLGFPGSGNGEGAGNQIHFAGLEGSAHFGGGNDADFYGVGVAEGGGGYGAAEGNVKAHIAAVLQIAKASDGVVAGANQPAAFPDGGEAAALSRGGSGGGIGAVHSGDSGFKVGVFRFQGRRVRRRRLLGTSGGQGQGQQGRRHNQYAFAINPVHSRCPLAAMDAVGYL